MIRIPILRAGRRDVFPDVVTALDAPNGLLAAGGDLSPERLLDAYSHGIFPWFSDDEPILWWSPDPRMVFATDRVHISTKLRRFLRACDWSIRADTAFVAVMHACAQPRDKHGGTWITPAMVEAYAQLHELGYAHSFEVYADGVLIGGIYGVSLGRMFFGESMFSRRSNASKVALLALCRTIGNWGFSLLDAQVENPHLVSMGGVEMPRAQFVREVGLHVARPGIQGSWQTHVGKIHAKDLISLPPPA